MYKSRLNHKKRCWRHLLLNYSRTFWLCKLCKHKIWLNKIQLAWRSTECRCKN